MRGKLLVLTVCGAVGFSTGCSTMAGTGALAGGGIGAGAGALVGAATGSPEAGAAIGGVLGAGVGAAVGADADQRERERADVRRVQAESVPVRGPMSVEDVIALCRPGATGTRPADETIIEYIRTSGSRFDLTPADIRMLSDNAVPDPVVRAMMNTKFARPTVVRRGPQQTVIVSEPPPVVVYERPWGYRPYYYAPPPPAFGFSYTRIR